MVMVVTGEVLLEVENMTPVRDSFKFMRIADGLTAAGHYVLEFSLSSAPSINEGPLSTKAQLTVLPGPAAQISVQARPNRNMVTWCPKGKTQYNEPDGAKLKRKMPYDELQGLIESSGPCMITLSRYAVHVIIASLKRNNGRNPAQLWYNTPPTFCHITILRTAF